MTDTFRKEYRPLSDLQKGKMECIKIRAQNLLDEFESLGDIKVDARALALAKTNLEQAVMWAIKAIT